MSREKQKGERVLMLGDERWGFKISGSSVTIMSPAREKHFVDLSQLIGLPRHALDGQTKPPIGPRHIKAYIEANLIAKA